MFTVYAQRYNPHEPFVLEKNVTGIGMAGDVIDAGEPVKIRLSSWVSEHIAKHFAENVKANTPKRMWKVWVE